MTVLMVPWEKYSFWMFILPPAAIGPALLMSFGLAEKLLPVRPIACCMAPKWDDAPE